MEGGVLYFLLKPNRTLLYLTWNRCRMRKSLLLAHADVSWCRHVVKLLSNTFNDLCKGSRKGQGLVQSFLQKVSTIGLGTRKAGYWRMLSILSQNVISIIRMLTTGSANLKAFDTIVEFIINTQNICTFKGFPGKQKEILKGIRILTLKKKSCCFDQYPQDLQNGNKWGMCQIIFGFGPNLKVCQGLLLPIGGKWITVIFQGTAHHFPLIGMPNPPQSNESGMMQIIVALSLWLHSPLSMWLNWCGIQKVMYDSAWLPHWKRKF